MLICYADWTKCSAFER